MNQRIQGEDSRYPTSSISNKLDLVKYYVKDSQLDIFSLSETWLTPAIQMTIHPVYPHPVKVAVYRVL